MYSRLNISIGLTIAISALVAVFVFLITIYIADEEIVRKGFALSGLISLLCFSIFHRILPEMKAMPDQSFTSIVILGGHLILSLGNIFFFTGLIYQNQMWIASAYAASTISSIILLAIYNFKFDI